MITVFDIETTFQVDKDGDKDASPKNPLNRIVSIGINDEYFFLYHAEPFEKDPNVKQKIQDILDKTTLLVAHNIKFDLMWLKEAGFTYEGKVYDTMLAEYILARHFPKGFSLKDSCLRRRIQQKSDIVDEYLEKNISFEHIPINIVDEYGRKDVIVTRSLFKSQMQDFKDKKNSGMIKTVKMVNEFCKTLIKMESNGIQIDISKLNSIEKEFQDELAVVKKDINETIWEHMGDTQINPSSSEQLSWLFYGVKPIDKNKWSEVFNIGTDKDTKKAKKRPRLTNLQFQKLIMEHTQPIFKTKAEQCDACEGVGTIQKYKKNKEPYVKRSKCTKCGTKGVVYHNLNKPAGFGISPKTISDVSLGGFKTDKDTLLKILRTSRNEKLIEFIRKVIRHSALETYLKSFVNGLKRHTRESGMLYPRFLQHRTVTGRLASQDPNFQNQPRGTTFPIRKAIISRWENGHIMEIDYAQLEFRTAVFLAQDIKGMEDIENGVDVHQFTADIIGCSRQDAKAHTFKPLYGGMSGTDDERRYYKTFLEKYEDIAKWHEKLQNEAIKYKIVKLPTGREYAFPYAKRQEWGGSSYGTQIKNYPVQGFATADIVPMACINVDILMEQKNVKSLLINTVHDSIVIDVYPGEEQIMKEICTKGALDVTKTLKDVYDIDFNVPLDVEVKIGKNWLDMGLA